MMWIFIILNVCITIFLNLFTQGGAMGMTTLITILILFPLLVIQLLLAIIFRNVNRIFQLILFIMSIVITIFFLHSLLKVVL